MRDNLLSNSQKIGNILLENFVDLVGINGLIDARGIGLMIGLEFDTRTTRDNIVNRLFKKKSSRSSSRNKINKNNATTNY